MKKIRVISCITTLTVMAMIFFFSSQSSGQSSELSMGVSREIAETLTKLLNCIDIFGAVTAEQIHALIRKMAHFAIYAVLGCSAAWMFNVNICQIKFKVLTMSVIFCLLYSVTDEVHQMFVDGRSAQITDVILDTMGAVCGALFYFVLRWIYIKIDYKFDGWITLTVIVMAMIFMLSSQNSDNSNELSKSVSHLFEGVYKYLSSKDSTLTFMQFNVYVRKTAHFIMFFILGGVTSAMLSKKSRLNIANIWLVSVVLSAMYAFGDEWHQKFVDGRGPLLSDVRIDICGAMAGIVLCIMYMIARNKKKNLHMSMR